MPGSSKVFASLTEISRKGPEIVFSQPRARWIGAVFGYLIAATIAIAIVRSMMDGRYSGWVLLWPAAGAAFVAVWLVCWTRQQFSRYELRLDTSARVAVIEVTPFLGKTNRSSVEATDVDAVSLSGGTPWILEIVFRDGRNFSVDRSSNAEPLKSLGASLASTFRVPFRDSSPV